VGSILLVEADPETRGAWTAALRSDDHDLLIAATPREALAMIREGGIDVIVIDSYDPRVGVVELARNLEALPDAPPIVLVSSSPHAPEISVRIGAAAFVAKPCDAAEVGVAAHRLLGDVRPVRVVDAELEDEPTGPKRVAG
jgi:two-component system catabolic regulation response regulator CreB